MSARARMSNVYKKLWREQKREDNMTYNIFQSYLFVALLLYFVEFRLHNSLYSYNSKN